MVRFLPRGYSASAVSRSIGRFLIGPNPPTHTIAPSKTSPTASWAETTACLSIVDPVPPCSSAGILHWPVREEGDMLEHTFDRRRFVRLLAAGMTLGGAALAQACTPAGPNAPTPTSVAPTAAALGK